MTRLPQFGVVAEVGSEFPVVLPELPWNQRRFPLVPRPSYRL